MTDPFDFDFSAIKAEDVEEYPTINDEFLDAVPEVPEDMLQQQYATVDTQVLEEKKRTPKARKYEKKCNTIVNAAFRFAVQRPETKADAATIALYGPTVAEKAGDLADAHQKVADFIDALDGGVESPILAFSVAVFPLAIQIVRNHEPILEPQVRVWKIPFTKNKKHPQGRAFTFKRLGIKLGILRNLTNEPKAMEDFVFGDAKFAAKLKELGINVATSPNGRARR